MSQKRTFVALAQADGANKSQLCMRFGISRPTGDKWIRRVAGEGDAGLAPRSSRPHHSPGRTAAGVEEAVLEIRRAHRAWGARKIGQVLRNGGMKRVPAHSTINEILHRHGMIAPAESDKHRAWHRFEHAAPNDLWQMDFKGHFALTDGVRRCHPLTILDDHSRFSICLRACAHETHAVVQAALVDVFRMYGMPLCILSDNGPPWGTPGVRHGYTALNAWLIELGIRVSHGEPYHPQTQGKAERFHRTLKAEVLQDHHFATYVDCQDGFDPWRDVYNCERPNEGIGMKTPVTLYRVSPRVFPDHVPPIEYGPEDIVRIVQGKGEISFKGEAYLISQAFTRKPVAVRATTTDGLYDVYFCHQHIRTIDLRTTGTPTPEGRLRDPE